MPGLPVPIVDDFEWVRLQEEIKHKEKEKQEENGSEAPVGSGVPDRRIENPFYFVFQERWFEKGSRVMRFKVVEPPQLEDECYVVKVKELDNDETD